VQKKMTGKNFKNKKPSDGETVPQGKGHIRTNYQPPIEGEATRGSEKMVGENDLSKV